MKLNESEETMLLSGWDSVLQAMKSFEDTEGVTIEHQKGAFTTGLDWLREMVLKSTEMVSSFGFHNESIILKYREVGQLIPFTVKFPWPEGSIGEELRAHFCQMGRYPETNLKVVDRPMPKVEIKRQGSVVTIPGFRVAINSLIPGVDRPVTLAGYIPLKEVLGKDGTLTFSVSDYHLGSHHDNNPEVDGVAKDHQPFSIHPQLRDVIVSAKFRAAVNVSKGEVRVDSEYVSFRTVGGVPLSEDIAKVLTDSIQANISYSVDGGMAPVKKAPRSGNGLLLRATKGAPGKRKR